jgi:hypothetical protein
MLGLGSSLALGGAPSEWTVADLPGIAHWFKYNTNLTLGTGDELDTWGDSYASETFTVAAGKVKKNGGDLNFDTNNGRMDLDATWDPGSFSAYIVFRITDGTILNEELLYSGNSDFFRLNNSTTARVRIGDTSNNDMALPGDEITQDTWLVLGMEWDGTTISIYQDTDYATPTTATDTDTFAGIKKLGLRSASLDGQVREVVMVDNVLSGSDRESLMTHLISVRDI